MASNICFVKINVNKLGNWIRDGLRDINRNQVWLAEKIGVQAPQVSRIISGSSETTPDLLSAIADALGKPRIQAYRAAGYLQQEPKADEWVEEMNHKLLRLPSNLRGVAGRFIDSMLEGEEKNGRSKTNPKSKPAKP